MTTITSVSTKKLFTYYLIFHIAVYYAWVFYGKSAESPYVWGTDITSSFASIIAAIALFYVYSKIKGPGKYFWLLSFLGCLSYTIAEGLRFYYQHILKAEVPFPGWPDLFYFLQILFYIAAFLYYVGHKKNSTDQVKFLFDMCIIMAVFIALSWHFIIQHIFSEDALSPLLLTISIGYPVGDLLLLFCAISFYFGRDRFFSRSVLALICGSLAARIVADTALLYYSATAENYIPGTFYDPLWSLGLFLTALAGLYALDEQQKMPIGIKPSPEKSPSAENGLSLRLLLPYFSLVLLFIVMIFEHKGEMNGLIAGAGTSVLLLISRQLYTTLENQKLLISYHQLTSMLEHKIEQRTLELSTKNEQLEDVVKKMKHIAYHDVLSGLPNRRLFLDKLKLAMSSADRNGRQVAVVFIDLDRFKNINDTFGHEFGDLLLKGFSQKMAKSLRQIDTISRQGGDEFTIILNELNSREDIVPLVERIQSIMDKPVTIKGQELHVSMSIGIAVYPEDGNTTDELMKHADTAMYHAKEKGENNYQFFSSDMKSTLLTKIQLEKDLRQAIANEEFVLHYQPQIHTRTGEVIGMETLIRWEMSDGNTISPGKFIPLAEETRLILQIDEWVLYNACRQAKAWHEDGHPHLKLAVNLSPLQFLHDNLMVTLQNVLEKTGFPASLLELEITEGVAVFDVEKAISRMQELRELGVQIAIDDFGIGYSSLIYLKRFPINHLKIAQPFIQDMATDPDDMALVEAMISIAHSLGMSVIAEGVETNEQLAFLENLDCNEVQGYLFSQPLTVEAFTEMLAKEKLQSAGVLHPGR
ncbi:EAL domain-containing protein [Planococcus shenhongbingii]|uniref:EAL domain-containing protein n=1 Tax=Planococcus shenhongbingii TaxID=3058398 RepID=A0ABT8NB90_9BACL|nr:MULTISPECIES: EAL domain-containing protein [unclassified Planococcus (in: firmicutes)]MDN7245146.1 EAL domain-containing protein [Planococcus sp. N017]WKA60522.1 EAL domain-containing protein [Planococcus sp. N016]